MNCKKYQDLSHVEKITYLGQLIHATQSDDELFEMGQNLIDLGIGKGVFDGVTILPESEKENKKV
jgi:hypothetical protein